jgi:hypothetical protein
MSVLKVAVLGLSAALPLSTSVASAKTMTLPPGVFEKKGIASGRTNATARPTGARNSFASMLR